jgi:hypothetical protein
VKTQLKKKTVRLWKEDTHAHTREVAKTKKEREREREKRE